MSRSCYSDDLDQWDLIRWRGAVKSALRGRRGQAFLREMIAALDALPEKRLVANDIAVPGDDENGPPVSVCAIGAVGVARGMSADHLSMIDPEYPPDVARAFGIAEAMAQEIAYENDEVSQWRGETPEQRWQRMRDWAEKQLVPTDDGGRG